MAKTGQRIRKHDMKEDSFVTFAFRAQEYIQHHQRPFIIGLVAVVAIVAGAWILTSTSRRSELSAEQRLTEAFVRVQQNDMEGAAQAYRSVVDDFGGTRAAREALYYLANLQFVQERWTEAIESYGRFAEAYGDDPARQAAAWAAVGDAYQALGDQAQALAYYERALASEDARFLADDIILQAARSALKAGDTTRAVALADRLYESAGTSPQMTRLRELLALHGVLYTRGF